MLLSSTFFDRTEAQFSSSNVITSVFETAIRYVGGYLSAYELSGAKYPVLVQKAEEIAAGLAYGWVGVCQIRFIQIQSEV